MRYIDTEHFVVYIKTDDTYKTIAEDNENRSDTSNYELNRALPRWKSKYAIGLMQDKLGWKVMTKFVGLRAKTYSYLIHDNSEDEKAKSTKKYVIKQKLKSKKHKNYLEETQFDNENKLSTKNNKTT